jgi:hypothetical protein
VDERRVGISFGEIFHGDKIQKKKKESMSIISMKRNQGVKDSENHEPFGPA